MINKTSIAAAIVLALVAGSYVPAAAAWGKKKQEQAQEEQKAEAGTAEAPKLVKGKNDIEGEIVGTPVAGSPFAKLEVGMSRSQVTDLIGAGKECGAYQTGKAWIPFRFTSSDTVREECTYKGAGRLIFTTAANGGSYLLKIVNDASEDGYR